MPSFGLGSGPVPPPARPPVFQRQPPAFGGGPTQGNIGIDMGTRDLPGTAAYSAKYAEWMKTPEAQATFHQQAVDQARFSNAINPASAEYNQEAAQKVKAATGGDPYDGRFREAMSYAMYPNAIRPGEPQPMPVTLAGKPPAPPPVAQPPVSAGGINAWQAARSMRKPPKPTNTGPMAPPRPYAIA